MHRLFLLKRFRASILYGVAGVILFGISPVHAQGLPVFDNLVWQAVSAIGDEIGLAIRISFKGHTDTVMGSANSNNLNTQQYTAAGNAGNYAAASVLSQNSTAVTYAQFARAQLASGYASQGAAQAVISYGQAIDTGVNANTLSPASDAANLCGLVLPGGISLIPNYFGNLANSIQCPNGSGAPNASNHYAGATMSFESVVGWTQYQLPSNMKPAPDGKIIFTSVTAAPDKPYADPVRYIIAERFCETLRPKDPNPVAKTDPKPLVGDASAMWQFIVDGPKRVAYDECMRAVQRRTACPQSSKNAQTQSGGDGTTCYDEQLKACKALTQDIGSNGLGIKSIGDPEADTALNDCTNNGLSPLMQAKIRAASCADFNTLSKNYGSNTGGDASKVEEIQRNCDVKMEAFNKSVADERVHLAMVILEYEKMRQEEEHFDKMYALLRGSRDKEVASFVNTNAKDKNFRD